MCVFVRKIELIFVYLRQHFSPSTHAKTGKRTACLHLLQIGKTLQLILMLYGSAQHFEPKLHIQNLHTHFLPLMVIATPFFPF